MGLADRCHALYVAGVQTVGLVQSPAAVSMQFANWQPQLLLKGTPAWTQRAGMQSRLSTQLNLEQDSYEMHIATVRAKTTPEQVQYWLVIPQKMMWHGVAAVSGTTDLHETANAPRVHSPGRALLYGTPIRLGNF